MHERDIFLAAIEIADPARRVAHVERACGGDPALRWRVAALLAAHDRSGEFLDVPALEQMSAAGPPGRKAASAADRDEIDLSFLSPPSAPGGLGRLGHYEIQEVVGRGGYGIVLKAFDETLHRVVAIKVMAAELAATSPARKRFLREARTAAAVRHDNVVGVLTVEESPLPFLVMEYVAGLSLQQKLDRTGPLDARDVVGIALQVTRGLAAAHAMGLIHRDIKPANILLEDGTDRVKITDFGLARAADDASLTQSGLIAGTPLYMSPEQAQGRGIDQRSDLFSLGSVMYVMACGRPPFQAVTPLAVLRRVAEDRPRPIPEVLAGVPDWLVAVVAKLQAKDPADRFASATEVADLLARCRAELQAHGRVVSTDGIPSLAAPQPRRPRRGRRRVAVALAALGAGLVVAELTGSRGPLSGPVAAPERARAGDSDDPQGGDTPALPRPSAAEPAPPPRPVTARVFRGHTNRVVRVLFTPDGTRLVSASNGDHHVVRGNTRYHVTGTDNSVRVWRVETGQEIRRFPMTEGRHYGPQGIAVTPDGRSVAVSSSWIWANGPPEPRVYVWDLTTGDRAHHFVLANHAIRSVFVAPDGARVSAARSGPGGIASWSLPDGRALPPVLLEGVPRAVEAPRLTWSPDGRYLLSPVWAGGGDFLAWETSGGRVARTFAGHTRPPNHIVMSADGTRLISCAPDFSVRMWEWGTGREVWRVDNLDHPVECVAFAPAGDRVLTGADDGTVTLRAADTGAELRRFLGHEGAVYDVAFSASGSAAASAGEDKTVRWWAMPPGDGTDSPPKP